MAAPSVTRLLFAPWLRYAVSAGGLAWLATQIDWAALPALTQLDWRLAVPAVVLAGLAYPLQGWRWHRLLAAQSVPLPPGRAQVLFWIGNFYNSFLPGGVAGDGVRLLAAWREHPAHKAGVAASILADRLLGLGALLGLAVLALGGRLVTHGTQRELEALFLTSAGALVLLAGGVALITHTRIWDETARRWLGPERAGTLRDAADALAANHAALLGASSISVLVWLLDFAALWLLARAVGLALDPMSVAVAAAAAYVVASLPISIGGHGVREGTLVLTLGWLGGAETNLVRLLALAFWCVTVAWSLAGGLAFFFNPRTR